MCGDGGSCFPLENQKYGECIWVFVHRNLEAHTIATLQWFTVRIGLVCLQNSHLTDSSSPIISSTRWWDSVSPQMHEASVKLMEKSEGVDHFTHIKLPSLEKLLIFPASSFLDPKWKWKKKKLKSWRSIIRNRLMVSGISVPMCSLSPCFWLLSLHLLVSDLLSEASAHSNCGRWLRARGWLLWWWASFKASGCSSHNSSGKNRLYSISCRYTVDSQASLVFMHNTYTVW